MDSALAECAALLNREPGSVEVLTLAGEIHLSRRDVAEAAECFRKATVAAPRDAAGWRRLGGACLECGRIAEADEALRTALTIEPGNARAHNNLGRALSLAGDLAGARQHYEEALRLDPDYGLAHLNLGVLLLSGDDAAQALRHIDLCLAAHPGIPNAWSARADALRRLQQLEPALASTDRALALAPDLPAALFIRAGVLYELKRFGESLSCCDRLLALQPDDLAHFARGQTLRFMGDTPGALAAFRSALRLNPDHLAVRWSLATAVLPALPRTQQEMACSRVEFQAALRELAEYLDTHGCDDPTRMVGISSPFYLAYHPCNNRELLGQYGALCADQMGRWQHRLGLQLPPASADGRPRPRTSSGRLRVGIVSAQVFNHSVFNAITRGWLDRLDSDRFDIHVFYTGRTVDAQTSFSRSRARHFEQGARPVEAWARSILEQGIDVLIYPEVGMQDVIIQLASMRLAPVQCVAWGHPETSGLPTIDYYLSASAFESDTAQDHYTEQLVRLPNLGVYYEPQGDVGAGVKAEGGAGNGGAPHFICAGTPFKYMPQHDHVFVEIARRLGRCRFRFFAYEDGSISRCLIERISSTFKAGGLDAGEFIELRPWASTAGFHALMRDADVMLDSIGFSGFNTVVQALQCDLPVVTRRGDLLRGRLGSGLLERLDMHAWVAQDDAQYINRAVELAGDAQARVRFREHLTARRERLYRDEEAITGFEAFLDRFR